MLELSDERKRECLQILGFEYFDEPSSSELKKKYKELVKKYHPDKNKGDEAKTEKFRDVYLAYKLLSDPSFRCKHVSSKFKNLDMVLNLVLSFEEAFFGGVFTFNINKDIPNIEKVFGDDFDREYEITYNHFEVSIIQLPPGSFSVAPIMIKGKGLRYGGNAGDLRINVSCKPDPSYRPAGEKNVQSQVNVPVIDMLKGGEATVKTMWGLVDILIPSGIQPGQGIEIKGHGVRADSREDRWGDHIVLVNPIYPDSDEIKESKAYKNRVKVNEKIEKKIREQEEERRREEAMYQRATGGGGFVFDTNAPNGLGHW
jgi:DnaJ-class molecular chaperone